MISLNECTLIGRCGSTPEVRRSVSPTGKDVTRCTFSVATSYPNNNVDKDEKREYDTTWHNVLCWGKTAEVIGEYLKRGNRVWVKGRITNRQYTSKEGLEKTFYEVVATSVGLIETKEEAQVKPEIPVKVPF